MSSPTTSLRRFVNRLRIVDKNINTIRLGPNKTPAQKRLLASVEEDIRDRRPTRTLILKARQMGFSTMVEAIMFWSAFMRPRMRGLVIAHDGDTSEHLLSINRTYWETAWFKDAYTERYAASNRLSWEETKSLITVKTAGSMSGSRGKTTHFVHGSEVAFWPKNPAELMSGLGPSIPRTPLSFVFLESTANGTGNWYHKQWKAAVAGESEYRAIFFGWWEHPEYCATAVGLGDRLTAPFVYLNDEERTLARFLRRQGIDPGDIKDKLLWRRATIVGECGNDLNFFHQEYPSVPEEAFISTGTHVFDHAQLKAVYEPQTGTTGNLIRDLSTGRPKFVPNSNGALRVFKTPGPNRDYHAYLIGGDPAWTESNMSDHSAAHVLNRRTWEQVAVFRRKMDAHDFGEQLLLLGEWYNDAIIAPDATKGGGATVEYLRAKQYPRIWIHKKAGKWRGQPERTYGFVTNANTKYESISNLQSLIADSARTGMGITIHDEATFAELSDFVVLDGAKMGNSDKTGFDDLVTALAITVTCTLYEALNLPTATPIAQRSTSIPTEHLRDHDVGVAPETSVDDRGRTVITAAPDSDIPPWLENQSTAFDFEGA